LGADWFYLASGNTGYIVAGIFKLFTGFFFIAGNCFLCCTTCCARYKGVDNNKFKIGGVVLGIVTLVLMIICSLINAIWYIVDWSRILADSFKDGNGVSLKNW